MVAFLPRRRDAGAIRRRQVRHALLPSPLGTIAAREAEIDRLMAGTRLTTKLSIDTVRAYAGCVSEASGERQMARALRSHAVQLVGMDLLRPVLRPAPASAGVRAGRAAHRVLR
jgi:hypothetical protein